MNGIKMSEQFWEFVSLKQSENEVANTLFNFEVVNDCVDYLDFAVNDEEINLSYLPSNRVEKITDRTWFTNPLRQEGKIGKILQKVFIEKPNEAQLKAFTEQAQAYYASNKYTTEVVTGEDIRKLYLDKKAIVKGELGSSCMRYAATQKYLDLYTQNSNVSMVCLLKRELVHARALLWHNVTGEVCGLTKKKFTVCDRIHAGTPEAKILIEDWAKDNCDLILTKAKSTSYKVFQTNKIENVQGMKVSLENVDFEFYPYLDTFFCLSEGSKFLSNTYITGVNKYLRSAEGGYSTPENEDEYDGEDENWDDGDDD